MGLSWSSLVLSLRACREEAVCKYTCYQSMYYHLKSSGNSNMNITNLFLLNPAENPKLIPTFFILAVRVVSVAL